MGDCLKNDYQIIMILICDFVYELRFIQKLQKYKLRPQIVLSVRLYKNNYLVIQTIYKNQSLGLFSYEN